jgi:SAM-dependent methyltransferase
MYDHQRGERRGELVYRDGEAVEGHDVQATYFAPPDAWSGDWKRRLASLNGPVLDVGCGAGTTGAWLEARGRDVVAIDVSPHAVRTARERGLEDVRVMDMFDLEFPVGRFRSVLAKGTQLGLAGSLPGVRTVLSDLAVVTEEAGVAIVDSYDPARLDPETFVGYRPDPREGVARRAFHFEYERPDDGGCEVGRTLSFVLLGPERLRDVLVGTPWELDAVWPREAYYRARLEK